MRKFRIWETLLSYLIGMKRKGRSILLGFGFVIGASVLILTVICFLFPSVSPSLMNPLLQTNLDKYYIKFSFPHWLSSSSNTIPSFSPSPPPSTSSPYPITLSPSPSSPDSTSSSPSPSPYSSYSLPQSPSPYSPYSLPQSPTSPSPELIKNYTDNSQTKTNYTEINSFKNSSAIAIDTPKVGGSVVPEEKSITTLTPGNVSTGSSNKSNDEKKQGNGDGDNCDISDGEWVRVNDPLIHYSPGSCPYLEKQPFDCHSNGKPDNEYLNWQWQWKSHPRNAGCSNNIPSSLNATDFLERLRGKKLVFSGDSLNRNMYMSLICIFWSVIADKSRIVRPSMYSDYKTRGDMSLIFKDYNCSVVFVWSPFLVNETNSKTRRMRLRPLVPEVETMRLDQIDGIAATVYQDADIVIFDSWHWWNTEKTNNGINYYQEGNYLYPKMGLDVAYKKAFTTWRRWIDNNIDSTKTQVVFRGFSLSHFVGGRWNTGGKCNLNTKPIPTIEKYKNPAPSHVKIIEDALRRMKTPVLYIDVGKLTFYRADAHPSIYGKNYTAQERKAAMHHQDCSHWCLPGVPDTWNELLYVSLLKAGKGSFYPLL